MKEKETQKIRKQKRDKVTKKLRKKWKKKTEERLVSKGLQTENLHIIN